LKVNHHWHLVRFFPRFACSHRRNANRLEGISAFPVSPYYAINPPNCLPSAITRRLVLHSAAIQNQPPYFHTRVGRLIDHSVDWQDKPVSCQGCQQKTSAVSPVNDRQALLIDNIDRQLILNKKQFDLYQSPRARTCIYRSVLSTASGLPLMEFSDQARLGYIKIIILQLRSSALNIFDYSRRSSRSHLNGIEIINTVRVIIGFLASVVGNPFRFILIPIKETVILQ
jgi:hypothetical protein